MACRCGKDHTGHEALDETKVIAKLAKQIADEIDQEIIDEIMAQHNPSAIPSLLKERK